MSRLLIVAGMHRSGTSLVANYLSKAGVDMGDELLPADVGNRHGYYEDIRIHDLHRELLQNAGIADGFTVSEDDLPIKITDDDRERARQIVRSHEDETQWGFKEPRTSLFCDLWFDVAPDATFLFLFRKPLQVLDSLMRRAAQQSIVERPARGLEVWRLYNEQMLAFSTAHPDSCVWFETDRLLSDPNALVTRLGGRFELRPVPIDQVVVGGDYHTNVRMRAKLVGTKSSEGRRCERLYQRLRELDG